MSFRDFTIPKIQTDFQLHIRNADSLFTKVGPVPISDALSAFWTRVLPLGLALITEKGRSELITAPLLSEVWYRSNRRISLLSGMEWSVDESVGLNGTADFLLCRSEVALYVSAPVLVAVEAKRDSIPDGLGQCAAEMVAAQRFNRASGTPIETIFGCVTTGANWKFLRLTGTTLDIDFDEYAITQADKILGILLHCCGVPDRLGE